MSEGRHLYTCKQPPCGLQQTMLVRCRAVVLLRRWLDEYAGGGPTYSPFHALKGQPAPAPPAAGRPLSRRQILDRYEQHTRHCPSCRRVRT